MIKTLLIVSISVIGLVGTLFILYADSKIIKTKPTSLVDKISPLLLKDAQIDSSTVYNERFFKYFFKKYNNYYNCNNLSKNLSLYQYLLKKSIYAISAAPV